MPDTSRCTSRADTPLSRLVLTEHRTRASATPPPLVRRDEERHFALARQSRCPQRQRPEGVSAHAGRIRRSHIHAQRELFSHAQGTRRQTVLHCRSRRFSTRRLGRMGKACLEGTIGAGPNLSKRASRVGRVSQPRTPTPRRALSPELIEDNGDSIVFTRSSKLSGGGGV